MEASGPSESQVLEGVASPESRSLAHVPTSPLLARFFCQHQTVLPAPTLTC